MRECFVVNVLSLAGNKILVIVLCSKVQNNNIQLQVSSHPLSASKSKQGSSS